jgi:acyl-CoA synthetase (AMP-forming)/AMP-acid ligase II
VRLIDFFDRGWERYPRRDCLHDGERGWTYEEVHTLTHRIAIALRGPRPRGAGLPAGAKVSIYSPNHVMGYACTLGIVRAGCVWAPINARNALDENLYILSNVDAELLFYHSSFEPYIARIRAECPKIATFVCIDQTTASAPSLEKWLEPHHGLFPDRPDDPDEVVGLVSSGGTTGRPKGVMETNRVMETMCANFYAGMPITEPPVYLVITPITHAAGLTSFPLLAYGATCVFMGSAEPEAIMRNIEKYKVSHLFLPPTVIYMMLAHPNVRKYDYSSLKNFVYAAAPMSGDKLRQALDIFGPVMTQTYGQAEVCMIATFFSPREHMEALEEGKRHRLLSCGKPAAFTRLAIMDDEGKQLPAGERGEIVVRSNLIMKGYYKNPQATEEASKFGWHHTGDIGVIDADGYVYIVDRKKDMIISGGFNIYPSEIEQVLWAHPAVRDCAVIGVPDDKWGEAVKAIIELKPGAVASAEELIALCKDKVGSMKAPKSVELVEALPRSPVGKVLKKDLRAKYWQGRDRAI